MSSEEPKSSPSWKPQHPQRLNRKQANNYNIVAAGEWEDQEETQFGNKQESKNPRSKEGNMKKLTNQTPSRSNVEAKVYRDKLEQSSLLNTSIQAEKERRSKSPGANISSKRRSGQSRSKDKNDTVNAKDLIKSFLIKGQVLLCAHLFSEAGKSWRKRGSFGDTPNFLREKNILKVEPDLLQKSVSRGRIKDQSLASADQKANSSYMSNDKGMSQEFDALVERVKLSKDTTGKNPRNLRQFEPLLDDIEVGESQVLTRNVAVEQQYMKRMAPVQSVISGEIVEIVTKTNRSNTRRDANIESQRDVSNFGASYFGGRSSKSQRGNTDKYSRQNKPSLYGKYCLDPIFFGDSYMNNIVFAAENNGVYRVQSKRILLTRRNIPSKKEMKVLKRFEYDENVYIFEEESVERSMINEYGRMVKRGRPDAELPVYSEYQWGNSKNKIASKSQNLLENRSSQKLESPDIWLDDSRHDIRGLSCLEKSWLASPISGDGRSVYAEAENSSKMPSNQFQYGKDERDVPKYPRNRGHEGTEEMNIERVYKEKLKSSRVLEKDRNVLPKNMHEWTPPTVQNENNNPTFQSGIYSFHSFF